jgi:hypothetical protein
VVVLGGTLLVVAGVVLISWKPEAVTPSDRAWHVLYPLGAGFLADLAFPLRRYDYQRADIFQLRDRRRVFARRYLLGRSSLGQDHT